MQIDVAAGRHAPRYVTPGYHNGSIVCTQLMKLTLRFMTGNTDGEVLLLNLNTSR